MKQLQLELNKRLLIVEFIEIPEVYKFHKGFLFFKFKKENEYNDGAINVGFEKIKEICKGSDLTEDIAKGFQHKNMGIAHNGEYLSAIEEFKFHISNHYYHWGENPEPMHYDYSNDDCETDFTQYYSDHNKWQESESRTFNPEKCIIFEIL